MYRVMGLKGFVKGHLPLFGKINKLIDDHEIPPVDFFPQRSYGGGGHNVGTSGGFERRDIRPVIYLCGRYGMLPPVTGKQNHPNAANAPPLQWG
jgi:hypothetical protein